MIVSHPMPLIMAKYANVATPHTYALLLAKHHVSYPASQPR